MEKILILFLCFTCIYCRIMLGGKRPVDLNDVNELEKLNKLASYGADKIAERRMSETVASSANSKILKYSARVVSAETQVVAGKNYFITVRINDANCNRLCNIEECLLVIWERSWENFKNLTHFSCKPVTEAKQQEIQTALTNNAPLKRAGGLSDVDPNDESAKNALNAVIGRINQASNSLYLSKLKSLISIKRQVVAGFKYNFEFLMHPTECTKSQGTNQLLENCAVKNDAKPLKCTGSVVDRAWIPSRYSNISFNCKNE